MSEDAVSDFLALEDYPAWHPAALGIPESLPEADGVLAPAPARPYLGEGSSSEPESRSSFSAGSGGEGAPKGRGRRKGAAGSSHSRYKKGFRKPPAKYLENSPFAPAIGAGGQEEVSDRRKRASSRPLFREGSALNEPVSDEEMLLQGVTPMPSASGGRGRGRAGQEPVSEFSRAKNIVLNQLAAAPKSRAMLEKKLQDKGISEPVIEDILARFEAVKLINDAEFADMFVRSRASQKKLSRAAIRRELKAKGIEGETADLALEQRSEEEERADALELVRRKLRPSMNLADRAEKEKVMRRLVGMLGRKGYPAGLAFSLVRQEVEAYAQEQGLDDTDSYDDSWS